MGRISVVALGKLSRQHGKGIERKRASELASFFTYIAQAHSIENIVFLCIGTDCSTGDALGPLVGSRLEGLGFTVVGTLNKPCDGYNYEQRVKAIPVDKIIIAIDACLGQDESVGSYLTAAGPLQPGQATRSSLTPSGHYSLAAIVNANGPRPYTILQMTPLSKVLQMTEQIVEAVQQVFQKL